MQNKDAQDIKRHDQDEDHDGERSALGAPRGFFGAGGSPVVEDGRVIANIGGKEGGIVVSNPYDGPRQAGRIADPALAGDSADEMGRNAAQCGLRCVTDPAGLRYRDAAARWDAIADAVERYEAGVS